MMCAASYVKPTQCLRLVVEVNRSRSCRTRLLSIDYVILYQQDLEQDINLHQSSSTGY
jgi:hypothetical protein